MGYCMAAAVLAGLVWAASPDTISGPAVDVPVRVKLGRDIGQPLGSLFEARDSSGRVVFGAGFPDAHSTYIRDNNRMLTFFRKGKKKPSEITPLGKPHGPAHNGVRLIADEDRLLALFRAYSAEPVYRLSEDGAWEPFQAPWLGEGARIGGVQFVDNRRLVFEAARVHHDGRTIYELAQGGQYYYVNGRLYAFHDEPQRLYVCPWDPASPERIDVEKAARLDIEGYPFAFGVYKDRVLVATNIGNLYACAGNNLERLRESDGKSWQVYSMTRVYDDLLLGQYPSGSLFAYNDAGLRCFEPPIPVPEDASPNAREAQTLAIFCGDLYAGVWPWGELWRYDPDAAAWGFVARVFDTPPVTEDFDEPFAGAMRNASDVYNYWGQRIVSLVTLGDSLYIGTMNKGGGPHKPEEHGFVDEAALAQYGRVHRLRGNAQVAAQFTWRTETEFRFTCRGSELAVFQDGVLLGKATLEEDAEGTAGPVEWRFGNGVYGEFGGEIVSSSAGG